MNVFGGGLALYNSQKVLVGAIGVSGDSSCADHNIAWKTRHGLGLDWVPGGGRRLPGRLAGESACPTRTLFHFPASIFLVHPTVMYFMRGLVLCLLAGAAAAQPPAEPAHIEGTVTNAVTGQPVRKARIELFPVQVPAQPPDDLAPESIGATTDAQGHYSLTVATFGSYRLTARHDGYMFQIYGASKPGEMEKGTPIAIAARDSQTKMDLTLTPLGAVSGRVLDESGDPVRSVDISVMMWTYGPTGRTLQPQSSTTTDDQGAYRLFDLAPAKYYLRAKPSTQAMGDDSADYYATVFYPSAAQPTAAAPIAISPGQEQRGLDFVLHTTPTGFIRGHVIKPDPEKRCNVVLADEDPDSVGFVGGYGMMRSLMIVYNGSPGNIDLDAIMQPGGRRTRGAGEFEFTRVPLGSHTVAVTCPAGNQQYRARQTVQVVSPGVGNLTLRPLPPSAVSGTVTIEGDAKIKLTDVNLMLQESGPGGTNDSTPATGDGKFEFKDVPAALYHLRVNAPNLFVKSIAIGSQDIQESGVDLSSGGGAADIKVVLSANGATLTGTVEDGEGAVVTLVPSRAHAEPLVETAGRNGEFSFADVPPGRYSVLAFEHADVNTALYDLDFRKPYESSAQTVDLQEGQKATIQLKAVAPATQNP